MKKLYSLFGIIFLISASNIQGRTYQKLVPVRSECKNEVGEILQNIRKEMLNLNLTNVPLQAYIVPGNDAHQSEYIADHDKRLQYISKFSGSAGDAVITETRAVLWTDSRYYLQAEQQLDPNCWTLMKTGEIGVPTMSQWLKSNLPGVSTVGVDPFIIQWTKFESISSELNISGHQLISVQKNLVDEIWISRPPIIKTQIVPLPIEYSGKKASEKIFELRGKLKEMNATSIVITNLDDIAWLLNLRGSDIKYNPVFFSYVILTFKRLILFVDESKMTNETIQHLMDEHVEYTLRKYQEILNGIEEMVNNTNGGCILITKTASQAIYELLPSERGIKAANFIADMKSIKNLIEVKNMEKAHIRDGLSLIRYLHWLNSTIDKERVTELSGAKKLEELRSQQDNFRGLSFETISAVGSHAAMAHYTPTIETDTQITRDEIYLVDSGGQYWDGTTDITRTVHFGVPTHEEIQSFTRVLKGFIALVTSVFPPNTPLSYFDHVARRPLWQVGLNYGHGTGHGVGAYLFVHEYPPSIGSKSETSALENMFTSNEPGYYKDGKFGIRIEDVIQVIKSDIEMAFDGKGALTFKSITYAPIQTKLIDTTLTTKEEATYVNDYNKRIRETIGPLLLSQNLNDTYQWLLDETKLICWWA